MGWETINLNLILTWKFIWSWLYPLSIGHKGFMPVPRGTPTPAWSDVGAEGSNVATFFLKMGS